MIKRMLGWAVLLVVATVALGACATMQEPSSTLYKRLGGREGIRLIVDDWVAGLAADARVNTRFTRLQPADVERVKTNLSDQICDATGGPCSYLGKDMKTVHTGLKITETEWTAGVEDLVKALDKHQVADKDKSELLGLLGPMKKDIVGQ